MQKLMGLVRRCVDDYHMIEAGDRIAVGVSGGKDSLALLILLAGLREYFNKPYELEAITIDMGLGMDYSQVAALCEEWKVPYTVVKTEIAPIIFDHRKEKNLFEGRINCFQPVTNLDRTGIVQIRPMLYIHEKTLDNFAARMNLPVLQNRCPVDKVTKRGEVKQLIFELSKTYPDLKERIFGAMQRYPLAAWEPKGRYKRPKDEE